MFSFLAWQAYLGLDSQLAALIKSTIDLVVLSVNLMDCGLMGRKKCVLQHCDYTVSFDQVLFMPQTLCGGSVMTSICLSAKSDRVMGGTPQN